jgi:hypothetical protein
MAGLTRHLSANSKFVSLACLQSGISILIQQSNVMAGSARHLSWINNFPDFYFRNVAAL